MIRTKINNTGNGVYDYRANVPFLVKPKIVGEKKIKGTEYYLGEGKRKFRKEDFDKVFKTSVGKIKDKGYKGELIGKHFIDQAEGSLI